MIPTELLSRVASVAKFPLKLYDFFDSSAEALVSSTSSDPCRMLAISKAIPTWSRSVVQILFPYMSLSFLSLLNRHVALIFIACIQPFGILKLIPTDFADQIASTSFSEAATWGCRCLALVQLPSCSLFKIPRLPQPLAYNTVRQSSCMLPTFPVL